MSSQRFILAIAILATLAVVAQCKNQVLGQRQHGDELVESKNVKKPAVSGEPAAAVYTCSPADGKKVTAVELVDRYGNKSAANGTILRGGVGQAYITVNIQSQVNYGIDHVVKCYAH